MVSKEHEPITGAPGGVLGQSPWSGIGDKASLKLSAFLQLHNPSILSSLS